MSSPSNDKLVLFEIFHDVLADPILDWKREIEAQQERAEHRRRVDEEAVEAQMAEPLFAYRLRRIPDAPCRRPISGAKRACNARNS